MNISLYKYFVFIVFFNNKENVLKKIKFCIEIFYYPYHIMYISILTGGSYVYLIDIIFLLYN